MISQEQKELEKDRKRTQSDPKDHNCHQAHDPRVSYTTSDITRLTVCWFSSSWNALSNGVAEILQPLCFNNCVLPQANALFLWDLTIKSMFRILHLKGGGRWLLEWEGGGCVLWGEGSRWAYWKWVWSHLWFDWLSSPACQCAFRCRLPFGFRRGFR